MTTPWEQYQKAQATLKAAPWKAYAEQARTDPQLSPLDQVTLSQGIANQGSRPPYTPTMLDSAKNMASGMVNNLTAGMQGASPHTSQYGPPLGEALQMDSGEWSYKGPDGQPVILDPAQHAIIRSPSGQFLVYQRNPEAEENPLSSLGRIASMGLVSGPPEGTLAGARSVAPLVTNARTLEAGGLTPTIATASPSRSVAAAYSALKDFVPSAGVIERGGQTQLTQARNRADEIASFAGNAEEPIEAGRRIQRGVTGFNEKPTPAGMSDQDIITMPTRASSFSKKAEILYNEVDKFVPEDTGVALTGTMDVLKGLQGKFKNAELAAKLSNKELLEWAQILERSNGTLAWSDARLFRSWLGQQIKSGGLRDTVPAADIKRLYGALSQDLRTTLEGFGDKFALSAFNRADSYYSAGLDRIRNTLDKFAGAEPEDAFRLFMKATSEGKAAESAKTIHALRRSLTDEEWGDVSAVVIRQLGKPKPGDVASQLAGFSPETFATRFNSLSPAAEETLFESNPALRTAMEEFVAAVNQLKMVERVANRSRSGGVVANMGMLGAVAFGGSVDIMNTIAGVLASAGGANAAARFFTSPAALRWTAAVLKVKTPQQLSAEVQRLGQLARLDPSLSEPFKVLSAAFSDQNPGQNR